MKMFLNKCNIKIYRYPSVFCISSKSCDAGILYLYKYIYTNI